MIVVADVTVSMLESIVGAISCFGCFTVIITYLTFADIRCLRYVELVFYVSLNDIIASVGVALGASPTNSVECWYQGLTSNINYLSSILWTSVISYQLWLVVHQGVTLQKKDMQIIHVVCWGFPVVVALLPLTTNTYGNEDDQSAWCFISELNSSPSWGLLLWEMLSFYLWVWVAIIVNVVLLFRTRGLLSAILVAGNADVEAARNITNKINKLIWYPRILILCWLPSTIVDLSKIFYTPDENSEGNVYGNRISTVFAVSQGWLLAVAFFTMNPIIRYKWRGLLTNKPVYKNNADNSYAFDVGGEGDESMRGTSTVGGYSLYSVDEEPDFISVNDSLFSFGGSLGGSTVNSTATNNRMQSDSAVEFSTFATLDSAGDVLYPGLRTVSNNSENSTSSSASGRQHPFRGGDRTVHVRNPIVSAASSSGSSGGLGGTSNAQYEV